MRRRGARRLAGSLPLNPVRRSKEHKRRLKPIFLCDDSHLGFRHLSLTRLWREMPLRFLMPGPRGADHMAINVLADPMMSDASHSGQTRSIPSRPLPFSSEGGNPSGRGQRELRSLECLNPYSKDAARPALGYLTVVRRHPHSGADKLDQSWSVNDGVRSTSRLQSRLGIASASAPSTTASWQ
jgi:hypothetical protein